MRVANQCATKIDSLFVLCKKEEGKGGRKSSNRRGKKIREKEKAGKTSETRKII